MEKRSLFQMIFGNKHQDTSKYQELQLLTGRQAQFSNFNGQLYSNSQIRACIDAIARNGAKLSPKHIRYYYEDGKQRMERVYGRVQTLISRKPNELMNAYDFYYKVISELELNNNAFIFISRNEMGEPIGLYPINSGMYRLLEYKGNVYIQFNFVVTGQTYTASLKDDVIHLRKFFCKEDIVGSTNEPIIKVMSLKHVIDEGIVNAIKTTQGIKGILKTTKAMLKPEDIKATRDQFVTDFTNSKTNIAGLDATTDFKEVNINPQTATDGQVKRVDDEVLNYFGINKDILQSSYTEEQWNAFYESILEPIAIQMGLEFTNKIFSMGERWHGNEIVFEANRMQYASTSSKIRILKEAGALGLMTINEMREILNLAPVNDGDQRVQSLNYIDKVDDDRESEDNENE